MRSPMIATAPCSRTRRSSSQVTTVASVISRSMANVLAGPGSGARSGRAHVPEYGGSVHHAGDGVAVQCRLLVLADRIIRNLFEGRLLDIAADARSEEHT